MQSAEAKMNRNCLLMALRGYSVAVRNMEQTVLLPSLLREVALDQDQDQDQGQGQGGEAAEGSCKDLYECYHMLKAIRNMAESGLALPDECKAMSHQALSKTLEPLLEADPEVLFDFHLKGLFSVLNNLAKTSQRLTSQYMEIIGIAN
ncbi:hypothetical protein AAFF_G00188440 [Aldrovandia affinis]|uniref:Mid1-interacting protein 1A n=1 Tax=Aldrovandia affinis TaxID=143900 RepID=A0AAD7SZB2_9TELE|nr:hypothetical protein AAFF_G00188440 [Aldrovandia affinis]